MPETITKKAPYTEHAALVVLEKEAPIQHRIGTKEFEPIVVVTFLLTCILGGG